VRPKQNKWATLVGGFIVINCGLRAEEGFVPPETKFLFDVLNTWEYLD